MKSQHLVVDTVRNWHRLSNDGCFQTRETGLFKLTLVSVPVEFEGTEEFKVIVLWGEVQPAPNPLGAERIELHKEIFKVIKQFAIGVNAKITEVKHDHLTTYVRLKTVKPKNVEAFEWLENKPEEYKDVE